MRQFRSPSRWTWVVAVLIAVSIAACDTSLEGINQQQTWGLIDVAATRDASSSHFADVEGLFFHGNVGAVPNADFQVDTCTDVAFFTGSGTSGLTHLDAGAVVSATIGGVEHVMERTTTSSGLAYQPTSLVPYTPGDSIFVDIPGAQGGYPAGSIRAKTAEAFTFPTNIDPPAGTDSIPLTWSLPDEPLSSIMVLSLRYAPESDPSTLSRQVLCNFVDDGDASVPFRWHQNWSNASERAVVVTRLRTHYVAIGGANLGVISTYQVPTPNP